MTGKRKAEATRWYRQAAYDLKAARWNIKGGFHNTACFLAQQAGEKALKSLLYYSGARKQALFTHSIVEMIGAVDKKVPSLGEILEEARELDLHYIPSRYPNGLPSGYPHQFYGKETSEKAVNGSEKIFELVTGHYSSAGEQDIIGGADEDQ
jgi:HEPN domain-containing protein